MMIYLAKFIACSGLLLAVYHLLLKNKAMYRFNRVFLLAGIVFSLCIPFIKFEQHVVDLPAVLPVQEQVVAQPEPIAATEYYASPSPVVNSNAVSTPVVKPIDVKPPNYALLICLSIYGLVTSLLLYRFIRNMYKIRRMAEMNDRVAYWEAQLVLIPQRLTPHSFFRYIFLNRDDHREHKIEDKILHHELAHTRQYHSADVVFAELVQAFCWFNPFLILYRRSIQLNHEFLADEAVLDIDADVTGYQHLLLSNISAASGLAVTSQLSYKLTKKRLIMMTKKTSATTAIVSRLATFILMAVAFVVFCNAAVSGKKEKAKKPIPATTLRLDTTTTNQLIHFQRDLDRQHYEHTEKGVPKSLLDEYHTIILKNGFKPGMTTKRWHDMIGSDVEQRMIAIYKQMSAEQQAHEAVGFAYFLPPTPGFSITDAQFKAYKNRHVYLTYVYDDEGAHSDLEKYKAGDLKKISFEKLEGEKWNYKVMLETNKTYDNNYKDELTRKGKSAMIFRKLSDTALAINPPRQVRFQHPYPHTTEGVSQDMLNEYTAIIQKYEGKWGNMPPKERKWEEADKARLITIYRQMSWAQQAKQIITFQYGFPPQLPVKPTQTQLDAFKDDHVYGVWIDDKKINNTDLDKYKPADFGAVLISTLTKNAYNYKRYRYEVSLLTVKYNDNFRKQMKGDELKDHMWTKMGPNGFQIINDQHIKKPNADTSKKATDKGQKSAAVTTPANWFKMLRYPNTKEGASADLMAEYASIVAKYEADTTRKFSLMFTLTPTDKQRLVQIYQQMSAAQQQHQHVHFQYDTREDANEEKHTSIIWYDWEHKKASKS